MYFSQQYNQYLKIKSSIEIYPIDVNPTEVHPIEAYLIGKGAVEVSDGSSLYLQNMYVPYCAVYST